MPENLDPIPVYIPSNIQLDILLLNYPTGVPNAKDYLLYILNRIKPGNTFTQISSKLQTLIQNYAVLLTWLVDRNIIEKDPLNYKVGVRPKAYRFTSEFNTSRIIDFITNQLFIRKIGKRNIRSVVKEVLDEIRNDNSQNPVSYVFNDLGMGIDDYLPQWMPVKEFAKLLNLRPYIMIRVLREWELVAMKHDWYRYSNPNPNRLFYYTLIDTRGGFKPSPMINSNFINMIRRLALEYPDILKTNG